MPQEIHWNKAWRIMILRMCFLICFLLFPVNLTAQQSSSGKTVGKKGKADPSSKPSRFNQADEKSALSWKIQVFTADLRALEKKYDYGFSRQTKQILESYLRATEKELSKTPFESLETNGKIDYLLFRDQIQYRLGKLKIQSQQDRKASVFLPSARYAATWWEKKIGGQPIDGKKTAQELDRLKKEIEKLNRKIGSDPKFFRGLRENLTIGFWTIKRQQQAIEKIKSLHRFFNGYDPNYSWWCRKPAEDLLNSLSIYQASLRRAILGRAANDPNAIVGQPIGKEALMSELRKEWIAYEPEQLIQIAEKEFQWCDKQMAKASKELGFDDWRQAQEKVKNTYVSPGKQPGLIREMAWEATDFVTKHDLVTIPNLAKNVWQMTMMSPSRQRVSPYFLGGDTIWVSFPTDKMSHADKMMSLRGNNPHFSRAVVHHELIPGHHLQGYAVKRHRPYRSLFATPFWLEGWALYWEMLLWDKNFARNPEDKIGMLFWRKHRCARIIFSLKYHLGQWTPNQCIDFLVERVGHERNNATAEVRRSVMGGYGPLYQAAYMLGGLQIRELERSVVKTGKMSYRDFHDFVLYQNSIPIELIRLQLEKKKIETDRSPDWKFYPSIK